MKMVNSIVREIANIAFSTLFGLWVMMMLLMLLIVIGMCASFLAHILTSIPAAVSIMVGIVMASYFVGSAILHLIKKWGLKQYE